VSVSGGIVDRAHRHAIHRARRSSRGSGYFANSWRALRYCFAPPS
jgi:hypothetical protein